MVVRHAASVPSAIRSKQRNSRRRLAFSAPSEFGPMASLTSNLQPPTSNVEYSHVHNSSARCHRGTVGGRTGRTGGESARDGRTATPGEDDRPLCAHEHTGGFITRLRRRQAGVGEVGGGVENGRRALP